MQCQSSTFNLTPYVQYADSRKHPWEDYYMEPQYDMTDFTGRITETTTTVKNYPWESWYNTTVRSDPNDPLYDVDGDGQPDRWWEDGVPMEITVDVDGPDGIPDNPGEQIWQKPVRTDMRANQNFNLGLSATLSIPLNRKLMRQCHEAAANQNALAAQSVANKRLDFEIARLKNCGELKKQGIMFHPKSPYFSVCADVVVTAPGGKIMPHEHQIPQPSWTNPSSSLQPSSDQTSIKVNPSSLDTDSSEPQIELGGTESSPSSSESSQSPSLSQASRPSGSDLLGVWQIGRMQSQQ